MREFRTQCLINAPLPACYEVLTDFGNYALWSPSHHSMERAGQELTLHLRRDNPNKPKPIVLHAQIRQESRPHKLAWGGGIPWATWLLDIHHFFELSTEKNQTKLVHGERFSGILGHLFASLRVETQLRQYRQFNEAFAQRCLELTASDA